MTSTSGHRPRSWLALLTIAVLLAGCASPVPTASPALIATPPPTATPTLAPTPVAPASPGEATPSSTPVAGRTVVVRSAADDGPGTLRRALADARPGDTITFDPAVFPPKKPKTIAVATSLPELNAGEVTIDASDAGVILDGAALPAGADVTGLVIASDRNVVRGLQIVGFPGEGFQIAGRSNLVGGDRSVGRGPLGQGNLISRNGNVGIGLYGADNTVTGNAIGTDPSGTRAWGNVDEGIYVDGGSSNRIVDNWIDDNGAPGVSLNGDGAYANTLSGNSIGVGADGTTPLGNSSTGVDIRAGAHDNTIGPANTIAHSHGNGVEVHGTGSIGNRVTGNRIHDNGWLAIDAWQGGDRELDPPVILSFDLTAGRVNGLTIPNARVELFSASDIEADVFEGTTTADASGAFTFEAGHPLAGPNLTATATDPNGDTTEVSLPVSGASGTRTLQLANPHPTTRLVHLPSNKLADNRIGSWWHSLMDYSPLSELLDETVALGVTRYRFAINGGEAAHAHWDANEFVIDPSYDEFVTALAKAGIQPTYNLIFWDLATWPGAVGTPCPRFKTEAEIEHYLDYVTFVVDHFKGRIGRYEIWNEPEVSTCPQRIDVADYINLVRRAAPLIHELDPAAKVQVGGTTVTGHTTGEKYLFAILESDVMPLVDVVSWHAFYGDSPAYNAAYYRAYPSFVARIKATASAHGFTGEYEADEMVWRPAGEPDTDMPVTYGGVAYGKYWARGDVMNLGLGVMAGNLRIPHEWAAATYAVRYLSTLMVGNWPLSVPVTVESKAADVVSYGFMLPDGDQLLAVWSDGVAADYAAGTPSQLVLSGRAGWDARGIDVLNGFEQDLDTSTQGTDLVIHDFMVRDYPLMIRLTRSSSASAPASVGAATGFCKYCGSPDDADARFCPTCGKPLGTGWRLQQPAPASSSRSVGASDAGGTIGVCGGL